MPDIKQEKEDPQGAPPSETITDLESLFEGSPLPMDVTNPSPSDHGKILLKLKEIEGRLKLLQDMAQKVNFLVETITSMSKQQEDESNTTEVLKFQCEKINRLARKLEPLRHFEEHLRYVDAEVIQSGVNIYILWTPQTQTQLQESSQWKILQAHLNSVAKFNLQMMKYDKPTEYIDNWTLEFQHNLKREAILVQHLLRSVTTIKHQILWLSQSQEDKVAFQDFKNTLYAHARRGVIRLTNTINWLTSVWMSSDCEEPKGHVFPREMTTEKILASLVACTTKNWLEQDQVELMMFHFPNKSLEELQELIYRTNKMMGGKCDCAFHRKYPLHKTLEVPMPNIIWYAQQMMKSQFEGQMLQGYKITVLHHMFHKIYNIANPSMAMNDREMSERCRVQLTPFSDQELNYFTDNLIEQHSDWTSNSIIGALKDLYTVKWKYCPCNKHDNNRFKHNNQIPSSLYLIPDEMEQRIKNKLQNQQEMKPDMEKLEGNTQLNDLEDIIEEEQGARSKTLNTLASELTDMAISSPTTTFLPTPEEDPILAMSTISDNTIGSTDPPILLPQEDEQKKPPKRYALDFHLFQDKPYDDYPSSTIIFPIKVPLQTPETESMEQSPSRKKKKKNKEKRTD